MRKLITNYTTARQRWKAAGKPTRTDEEVRDILENKCRPCPLYRAIRRTMGRCKKCGCALNLGRKLNKLYWATEECPDDPPRWLAKVVQDENGEWIENPELHGGSDVADKDPVKEQPEETPREARARRRRERQERRAKRAERAEARKKLGKQCDPIPETDVSTDELRTYDRKSVYLASHPLRDYWKYCPAFLVCGGPSLNEVDTTLLEHPAVCSMAVNNVAAHIRPKAFVYSDPTEKFHGAIFLNPGIMVFAPMPKLKNQIRLKNDDGEFEFSRLRVRNCPSVWGFDRHSLFEPEEFLTSPKASWGCSKGCAENGVWEKVLFTPFLGLRLLHYLGVREVFLLGMDFTMSSGKTGGYCFPQARTPGASRSNNSHYRRVHSMMDALKPVLDEANFKVYNCNKNSHLSTFPFYPYEEAVAHCKSLMPNEPLDLSGWYEKNPNDDGFNDSSEA